MNNVEMKDKSNKIKTETFTSYENKKFNIYIFLILLNSIYIVFFYFIMKQFNYV